MIKTTRQIVQTMIEDNSIGAAARHAALVVVSSLKFGPKEKYIHLDTGLEYAQIRPFAERLRGNGFWKDGNIYMEKTPDEKEFFCELILVIMCARGELVRVETKHESHVA